MSDPREEFEYEFSSAEPYWTETQMKFLRAGDGGYRNRDLHMAHKGWRLAKTQKVRAALSGNSKPWLLRKQAEAVEAAAREWSPEDQTYSGRKPHKELIAAAQRLRTQADELEAHD